MHLSNALCFFAVLGQQPSLKKSHLRQPVRKSLLGRECNRITSYNVCYTKLLRNEADHSKKILFHPKMLPSIVISDPELTLGLPPHITAATGMDALAHCLEAYCVPSYHPMAEGIAIEGMRLIKGSLSIAVRDGKDLTARSNMMAAASMGAAAFQKGLGAIHALRNNFV